MAPFGQINTVCSLPKAFKICPKDTSWFGIWDLGLGIFRTSQVLFGSGLSGLWTGEVSPGEVSPTLKLIRKPNRVEIGYFLKYLKIEEKRGILYFLCMI